ncbi:MAG: ATP-dependent helicase, partial [Acidimicrobiia bacterium]|nr:ATP-dependent helicase [Acidimicrobiia bacterium]
MSSFSIAPVVTPHGRLILGQVDEEPTLEPGLAGRLREAFARGSGHGLLQLGAGEVGTALPPVFSYWRELGTRYVTALCTLPEAGERGARVHVPAPPDKEMEPLASAAPPMTGAEYLTPAVLHGLWEEINGAFGIELSESGGTVQEFLKRRNPAWNLVGRVHFNLAENPRDEEAPFAFLATYTPGLSAHARAQHLPLGQALRDYA